MSTRCRTDDLDRRAPADLRGASLRYCLLTLLHDHGPASIPELQVRLERSGLVVGGVAANKTISDALRHECTKGRVHRVARGWYAAGQRPERTIRRHRARFRDLAIEAERRRAAGPGTVGPAGSDLPLLDPTPRTNTSGLDAVIDGY